MRCLMALLACAGVLAPGAGLGQSAEANWLTDPAQAQAQAKSESKMVLILFTGSDWCPPCKALERTVLSTPEFAAYARSNLVLVKLDFPRTKPQSESEKSANAALAAKFGVEAFPTVLALGSTGKELKRDVGYDGRSAGDFIAALKQLKP
jgi:thiol-disulfide isomerase/thioredoxin